jgi:transposase
MASTRQRRRPQKYPEELRERAVRMVFEVREQSGERHGVITRVARELGVGAESLRSWVRQAEIDSGRRGGTTSADAQRIAQLEREVRELRRANDMAVSTCQRNESCEMSESRSLITAGSSRCRFTGSSR